MLKYHAYESRKYIAHSAHRVLLAANDRQGTDPCTVSEWVRLPITFRSASLTAGWSSGRLRNQPAKATHQMKPRNANKTNACRHESGPVEPAPTRTAQSSGV